jgi:hypothetical protein
MNKPPASRWTSRVTLILAVLILIPSLLGFAGKFLEFVHVFSGETDGVFAITPIVNYLLATCGFLLLLLWATVNGMFHDIERPKYTLLEREAELDRQPSRTTPSQGKVA